MLWLKSTAYSELFWTNERVKKVGGNKSRDQGACDIFNQHGGFLKASRKDANSQATLRKMRCRYQERQYPLSFLIAPGLITYGAPCFTAGIMWRTPIGFREWRKG